MDDLYPNDGSWFQPIEPEKQIKESRAEKSMVLSSLKLIDVLLKDFQSEIDFHKSTDSIPEEMLLNEKDFMIEYRINQGIANKLSAKKAWLEGLRDTYKS